MQVLLIGRRKLRFAVLEEAVRIATISLPSCINSASFFSGINPASIIIANQNSDSSASSIAMAIFEMKVGFDCARQADR